MGVGVAVILAAGEGRRLRPVTAHTPKALMPAFGTPLLDIAVAQVVRGGVRRIAVNAHHLGAAVEERVWAVLAPRYPGVRWTVSREPTLLGTGGALVRLGGWIGGEAFWVVNADALFIADLREMRRAWLGSGADAAMLVTRSGLGEPHAVAANVRVDAHGDVVGLGTDGPEDRVAYCGVLLARAGLLDVLARTPAPSCVVRQGLIPWIGQGARVAAWEGASWFADTGTPERYLAAHRAGLVHADRLRTLGVFNP